LALTSPTGGGRSVGIVRSRTKATEFSFSLCKKCVICWFLYHVRSLVGGRTATKHTASICKAQDGNNTTKPRIQVYELPPPMTLQKWQIRN